MAADPPAPPSPAGALPTAQGSDAPVASPAAAPDSSDATAWLDGTLALAVLALAFLLGAFAVRNSDFWLHLATGRLIASGQYSFGTDPFSYTTAGVPWVNHAWLFDLVLYGLYRVAGGAGVGRGPAGQPAGQGGLQVQD